MTFVDQVANKREVVKPIHKKSPSIFYWVAATLEVVTAGTIIVAVLYATLPFNFA